MTLDTTTTVVIGILIDVVLLLILTHSWWTRTTYAGFLAWIAGTACWIMGPPLTMLFSNALPPFISKVIGNTLIMLHPMLLYEGIIRFHNIPRRWWMTRLNVALALSGMVGLIYFLLVDNNIAARAIIIYSILAVFITRTALEPLLYPIARRYSMQWLLSACLLPLIILSCVQASRVWNYFQVLPVSQLTALITQDRILFWLLFYGIIVELVIAYCYLSLTSDRVEEELRESEESYRTLTSSLQTRIEEEISRRVSQERLLAKNSRLAAMGEMISAIAHQWRQPLATLAMIVQRTHAVGTMQGLTGEYLDEFKSNAMRQVRYMSDTIEEFRGFYRPEKRKEPFSPFVCISDSVRLFEPQFNNNGILVSVMCQDCDTRLINGFPNEFKQVALNLLGNARDAILESRTSSPGPEKGSIIVRIWVEGSSMIIEVSDNGCGIPPGNVSRIFDPYFTTKEETGGTGIGLYMSRMIVEDSFCGHLSLLQSGVGATFRIELPLEDQP
jgi:signal transduction histidine kinase